MTYWRDCASYLVHLVDTIERKPKIIKRYYYSPKPLVKLAMSVYIDNTPEYIYKLPRYLKQIAAKTLLEDKDLKQTVVMKEIEEM